MKKVFIEFPRNISHNKFKKQTTSFWLVRYKSSKFSFFPDQCFDNFTIRQIHFKINFPLLFQINKRVYPRTEMRCFYDKSLHREVIDSFRATGKSLEKDKITFARVLKLLNVE